MPHQSTRDRRNRSIRNAVATSLLSKGSTALLQFISLPIAARVLGRVEFGIYATISMAVLMVAILQLGVAPALGQSISEASAKKDRKREGQLYKNGAILVVGFGVLGLILAAVLIATVPLPVMFGPEYAPFEEQMRPALWIGVLLMLGLTFVETTDRVREGYMESDIVNTWATAGNLVGAVVVFTCIRFQPSISFLLLAVFGPNIIARAISTVLLLKKRPWLISGSYRPDRATMIKLIREGLSFSATSFLVYTTEIAICALIIGRISGPDEVAIFQVLVSITTAYTGMLIMVGRPIWAAIADAKTRKDQAWMTAATRRYYQYLVALTAAAGVMLIGFGPLIIPLLYGSEFTVDRLLLVSHAVFLLAIGWRLVNRYLAIGLGLISRTVAPILIGLALGTILGTFGLYFHGLWALYASLAIGTFVVPGILLPRLVRREMHSQSVRETMPDGMLNPSASGS